MGGHHSWNQRFCKKRSVRCCLTTTVVALLNAGVLNTSANNEKAIIFQSCINCEEQKHFFYYICQYFGWMSIGVMEIQHLEFLFRKSPLQSESIHQYFTSLLAKFEVALQYDEQHLLLPSLLPQFRDRTNGKQEDMKVCSLLQNKHNILFDFCFLTIFLEWRCVYYNIPYEEDLKKFYSLQVMNVL